MAIQFDYTPMAAVGGLAREAGVQQQARQRQAMQFQADMAHLQQQFQQQNQAFQFQAQQAARAEEFGYQTQFMQMKRQMDIEMELREYAQDREKLNLSLGMIRDSDHLSDGEKDELVIQATARYGNVGQGITASSFEKTTDPFTRKALESQLKFGKIMELQELLNKGEIDVTTAERAAMAFDLGKVDWMPGETRRNEVYDRLTKEYSSANKALQDVYEIDLSRSGKETVTRKDTGAKVRSGTPEYEHYKTMRETSDEARAALAEMMGGQIEGRKAHQDAQEFMKIYDASPSMQAEVARLDQQGKNGIELFFDEWRAVKKNERLPRREPESAYQSNPMTGLPSYYKK